MKPISCIFSWEKLLWEFDEKTKKMNPVLNTDGTQRRNANFISFLQVISAYWELVDEKNQKYQLNIFLNGGSVSFDRNSGERTSKAGYTLVLPHKLGELFMASFLAWGESYGLSGAVSGTLTNGNPSHQHRERSERGNRNPRIVRDEDFIIPGEEQVAEPSFEQ